MTDEERADEGIEAAKWTYLAVLIGFNELAKNAKTIGERIFFRLARDQAEKDYEARGGVLDKIPTEGQETVLVIRETMPRIAFEARDIEMMRAAVAAHDRGDASDRERTIYVASKTRHAERWRSMRANGVSIISTWIDDPVDKEPGGAVDHADLWDRCIREASSADVIVVYHEEGDVLKGAFAEVGAALACGVPVFLVGDPPGTCWHHRLVTRCASIDEAFAKASETE